MANEDVSLLEEKKRLQREYDKYKNLRVYTKKPVTMFRSVGFGTVDFMGGGWNTIISGLLLFFFSNYGGLTATQGGTILLVARIVDAIAAVFIGTITDNFYRTRLGKRFGRRHFFLLISAPLLAITFPFLWMTQKGFWYYLVIYLVIEILIALILIPWETLPTEMTDDYTERTKLSSTRMFLSATGTFAAFFIPAIVKQTGNPNAYLITGIVLGILYFLGVIFTYFTTWEKPLDPETIIKMESQPKFGFVGSIKHTWFEFISVFKLSSYVKHLGVYLFSYTGKDVYASALTFFTVYVIFQTEAQGLWLQAVSIVGLPVTVIAGFLMVRKGPRFLWSMSFSFILVSLLGVGLVYLLKPSNPFAWMLLTAVVYQAGRALLEFTPWNVYPFMPDVDYVMTREHRAGIYASVMTFFRKLTGALGTWIVGFIMDHTGYIKPLEAKDAAAAGFGQKFAGTADKYTNVDWEGYAQQLGHTPLTHVNGFEPCAMTADKCEVVQSAPAMHGIAFVTIILPAILIICAWIISRFVYLNKETHDILMAETKRLEEGGSKEDVTPETKKVLEDLTGHRYETLWPEVPLYARS
ncbi:MFS transporter [Actinobaculum suis]|nr:MFS transporter [Actinobaculum suis]